MSFTHRHHADFVDSLLIIMAMTTQGHCDGQRSWQMLKMAVFTVISIFLQPYINNCSAAITHTHTHTLWFSIQMSLSMFTTLS